MTETWIAHLKQHDLSPEMIVFTLSMGLQKSSIVAAKLLGVPMGKAYLICFAGSAIPIPFILAFIQKSFVFLKRFDWPAKWVYKMEMSALKKSRQIRKRLIGLYIFVALPLPGTGGITGALIAAMLHMPFAKSLLSILFGMLTANLVMIFLSYFIPGLFGF